MGDQAVNAAPAKGKTVRAREISKWSMAAASIWIAGLSLSKAFWPLLSKTEFGLTMNEILLSGMVLAAVCLSLWIDKFTAAFKGGNKTK